MTHQLSQLSVHQGQTPPHQSSHQDTTQQDTGFQDGGYHTQDSEYHQQQQLLQFVSLQGGPGSSHSRPSSSGSNSASRPGLSRSQQVTPALYTTSGGGGTGGILQESDSGNEHSIGYENY